MTTLTLNNAYTYKDNSKETSLFLALAVTASQSIGTFFKAYFIYRKAKKVVLLATDEVTNLEVHKLPDALVLKFLNNYTSTLILLKDLAQLQYRLRNHRFSTYNLIEGFEDVLDDKILDLEIQADAINCTQTSEEYIESMVREELLNDIKETKSNFLKPDYNKFPADLSRFE